MIGEHWIGKTNTERLVYKTDGVGLLAELEEAKSRVTPEKKAVMLRKEFSLPENAMSAKLNICGLGYYVAYLNGSRVGDYVLDTLETNYFKRVLYTEYDVTNMLHSGKNCIGVVLGNSRYSPSQKYWDWRSCWYGDPCLTAELICTLNDGSTVVVSTDNSWKTSYGPIIENCFFDGETYDSRLEEPWREAGFDDSAWDCALEVPAPSGKLEKNDYFHIKVNRELKPCKTFIDDDNRLAFQFEENISGWVRVELEGPEGAKAIIRHAEVVEGTKLNMRSNRNALNRDTIILSGKGRQVYEPSFVLHGFSAVSIEADEGVKVHDVTALFVFADVKHTGSFSCDNADVMKIHEAVKRTQSAAMMSFPLDCPQRDERLGWLGDAHTSDLVCMYNFDMRGFYRKWMQDIRLDTNSQFGYPNYISPRPYSGPHAIDWASAYSIIQWDSYLFYRDSSLIEEHYDSLKKYIDFLVGQGAILPRTRYGDWQSTVEGFTRGDPACCSSLYSYYNLVNFISISKALGKDVSVYEKIADLRKYIIFDEYYDSETGDFGDGSQMSISFALKLGIVPEDKIPTVLGRLEKSIIDNDYHIVAGIFGTKYIMEVLRDHGRFDLAEKLIFRDTYPSWLDMLKTRTTITERWEVGRSSQNHCMLGSIDAIFYSMYAGIRVGENITIDPYYSTQMNHVSATTFIGKGNLTVEWTRNGKGITVSIDNQTGEPVSFVMGDKQLEIKTGSNNKFEI